MVVTRKYRSDAGYRAPDNIHATDRDGAAHDDHRTPLRVATLAAPGALFGGVLTDLLDMVDDPVVIVGHTGATLLTNAAYDALTTADDGAAGWLDEHGEPAPPEQTPLARAARAEAATMLVSQVDAAGVRRTYRATIRPLHTGRYPDAAGCVVFRDLTDQEARKHADHFVQLLSHELAAPLASLQSHAELFTQYLDPDLTEPEARFAMERVQALAGRLGVMVHDLHELARISAGKLTVRRLPLDLRDVVQTAVEIAQEQPMMPPIHVESVQSVPPVTGDAHRLSGVLLNLLTNAAVHAHTTDGITVRIWSDDVSVSVDVEDRGQGIPPAEISRIFELRYQVRRPQGSVHGRESLGLGLYLAQHIVAAHGGHIRVLSEVGVGSRFTISLPRA